MNEEISNDLSCLENDLDIVVISTGHSFYKSNEFIKILERKKELFILDTVGLLSEEDINKLSTIHKIKVLGRGDLWLKKS